MKHDNFIRTKISPALIYIGGKSLLSRRILSLIKDHYTYVEPFAGGLNVLLNKHRSAREIASDLNQELIEFYQVLILRPGELSGRIREIPYTREIFLTALHAPRHPDPFERVINTIIKHQMSRNGQGQDYFHSDNFPDDAYRRWSSRPESLLRTAERLQGVEFRCQDAFEVIPEFSGPENLIYADPPYYPATRVSHDKYKHELSGFDHLRLLRLLKSVQGQVILSGYPSEIYNRELAGWTRVEFDIRSNASQSSGQNTKLRASEVLWVKPHWPF